MSEAGRKLTIRMPDNPRLRSVEVAQLHTDPGERVLAGTPIMSLHKGRRDHIVRTPRPGKVVPLVAIGDKVEPGDPLYILHLDEQAMLEQNRAERALIAQEQARWSDGITPDKIEPIARSRKKARPESRLKRFAGAWGKPILAVALYVLACFALLPILHTFGEGASVPTLVAMCVASVLFGALIYYLYAPDAGPGPRWVVRLIAASWVAISAVAIFYRPDVTQDFTIADATSQIGALFRAPEAPETLPAPAEEVVTELVGGTPAAVVASGVQVGLVREGAVPEHTMPRSILTFAGDTPVYHGVGVRTWARINPGLAPGRVLAFELDDAVPGVGIARSRTDIFPAGKVALLSGGDIPLQPAPDLEPGTLIAGPVPQVRADVTNPSVPAADESPTPSGPVDPGVPGGALVALVSTETASVPGDGTLPVSDRAGTWLAENGLPVVLGAAMGGAVELNDIAWQGGSVSAPPSMASVVELTGAGDGLDLAKAGWVEKSVGWLHANGVPVVLSSASERVGVADDPWTGLAGSMVPGRGAAPARLAFGRTPDLLLFGVLRAGEADWMDAQTARLAGLSAPDNRVDSFGRAGTGPVSTAEPARAEGPASLPGHDTPSPRGNTAAKAAQGPTAPLRLARASSDGLIDAPAATRPEIEARRLEDTKTATAPSGLPGIPAIPTYQPASEGRHLLFVYFDDPRLESHPGIGDTWAAPVSEGLSGAVLQSEVIAEKQIIQVQDWCPAVNDPSLAGSDGAQTAWLSDRIRLLQVSVEIESARIADFEAEIPLFDGTPAGFFHNRAPVMGALPGSPLLDDGMAYLRSLAAGIFDPASDEVMAGGQYFDSPRALATILKGAGCVRAEWNGGGPPENAIGRELEILLGG